MSKSKWIKRGKFVLFSLITAEILLRIFSAAFLSPAHLTHGLPLFVDFSAGIFKKNGQWGALRTPSAFFPHQSYRVPLGNNEFALARINNYGFRGNDFQPGTHHGIVRIATLGASSTFGFGNSDDQTYPRQLEAFLNTSCPAKQFEVYNFGIPYINSDGIARLYRDKVREFSPDAVTFYEGANDTGGPPQSILGDLWDKLRTFSLWVEFLNVPIRELRSFGAHDVSSQLSETKNRFIGNLDSIALDCESRGSKFLPATQQVKSYLIDTSNIRGVTYENEYLLVQDTLSERSVGIWALRFLRHHELMSALRTWAKSRNILLVDIQKALDEHRDELTSWVHLTASGNEQIAEAFGKVILELFCAEFSDKTHTPSLN